jgi:putative aldouronate transport system substrate-binding protein
MQQKVLAAALAAGLCLATGVSAQAADPFGKYPSPITISMGMKIQPTNKLPDGDTADNNQYTRYVADTLNIKSVVNWVAAEGKDYDQKVNLAIAAGDLPDGLVVTNSQLLQMVKADELADLTDVYNKYASPAMKDMMNKTEGKALKGVTFKGKILAIPSLSVPDDGYHVTWIRKDWLDKLGLKAPKTLDELVAVAQAFMDKDPGNNGKGQTIGISGQQSGGKLYANFLDSTNNNFGLDPLFASFNAYPGFWIKGADGKAVYGSTTPETKKALAKLAELYKKGILDQEIGIRKDATEAVVGGKTGVYFGCWWNGYWPLPDAIKNNPNANWQAYTIPLDGKGKYIPHSGSVSNFYTVVRKGYEHPEAVIKMLNVLIRDEGTFDISKAGIGWYPLRVPMAMFDEGPMTIKAMREVLKDPSQIAKYQGAEYAGYKLLKTDVVGIGKTKVAPFDKTDIQYWNTKDEFWSRGYSYLVGIAAINDKPFDKVYSLLYYQTKTMETRWANLRKLEDEAFLKIIFGAPIDTFDTFVKAWKAQGGDTITKEVDAEAAK